MVASSGHKLARSCLNLREQAEKFLLPAREILYTTLAGSWAGGTPKKTLLWVVQISISPEFEGGEPKVRKQAVLPESPGLYPPKLEGEAQDEGVHTGGKGTGSDGSSHPEICFVAVFSLTGSMQKSGSKVNPSRQQSGRTLGLLGPVGLEGTGHESQKPLSAVWLPGHHQGSGGERMSHSQSRFLWVP